MLAALPGSAPLAAQAVQVRATVSEQLPHYKPAVTLKDLTIIPCTDAISDLSDEWIRGFKKYHPSADLVFRVKVTTEAVTALQIGMAPVVLTAREFSAAEVKVFQDKFGYAPMRIPVCLNANIVFVNKANPITAITMTQLDAIYSRRRLGGAAAMPRVWGDLGVAGAFANTPIHAYCRADGTADRVSFAAQALLGGEYREDLTEEQTPTDVAEAVTADPGGIAFSSMDAWFATNKTLPVRPYGSSEAYYPTQDLVTASKYPMPRMFYIYVNRAPGKALPEDINEVLHYLLSQEGQNVVADVGMLPGPVEFMTSALKRLN